MSVLTTYAGGCSLANAFTELIQEFVTDILLPPISILGHWDGKEALR